MFNHCDVRDAVHLSFSLHIRTVAYVSISCNFSIRIFCIPQMRWSSTPFSSITVGTTVMLTLNQDLGHFHLCLALKKFLWMGRVDIKDLPSETSTGVSFYRMGSTAFTLFCVLSPGTAFSWVITNSLIAQSFSFNF